MPLPPDEPDSPEAVAAWLADTARQHDRFADVYDASEAHREQHGPDCVVYPSSNGPLLATLAAATGARRIFEAGCGLGYGALHLADGSAPRGVVHTTERDGLHARLAMQQIAAHGFSDRITVHPGSAVDTLAQMTDPFDLIFNDASLDEYEDLLVHFMRLLRPGGLLVSSNLFLAQYDPDIPGLDHAIAYRRRLIDDPALRTAFTSSGLALTAWRRD